MTRTEMEERGWKELDVLLVSGDAYVDHPSFGIAVIGRVLLAEGYRVGIIAQPDCDNPENLTVMGRPRLFAGISSGNMDSMVNHYTSQGRLRSNDAYTPGGRAGVRPDRALLRYTNCVQRVFKGLPIVLGGIEASLRRVSHYDFWSQRIKKSILLDTKAQLLVYGMGERQIVKAAEMISSGEDAAGIPGTCRAVHRKHFQPLPGDVVLPSHEDMLENPSLILNLTRLVEKNQNPWKGARMVQPADSRMVIVEPPPVPMATDELDRIYQLPYTRLPHPGYSEEIPAYTMIRDSVTVVRGCSGGCSFCAIGLHQGKYPVSRSMGSVLKEVRRVVDTPGFGGVVTDLGGPTANLYGLGCTSPGAMESCTRPSCLYPEICPHFSTDHSAYMELLEEAEKVDGVRRVFISSGIRHDVALGDKAFVERLAKRNISGHLRIAPEHTHDRILALMRKPGREVWLRFAELFSSFSGGDRYIMPYIMAAFPGCTIGDMQAARSFILGLGPLPRQVQIFLPTPMTPATAMYLTGRSYEDGEPLRIPRKPSEKQKQKEMVLGGTQKRRNRKMNTGR